MELAVDDSVSWIKGAHELKFGFDLRRQNMYQDPIDYSNVQGFSRSRISKRPSALRSTTGNSFASFRWAPDSASVRYTALNRDTHFGHQAWFVGQLQSQQKVDAESRLRHEILPPRFDANNEMSGFDLTPNQLPAALKARWRLPVQAQATPATSDSATSTTRNSARVSVLSRRKCQYGHSRSYGILRDWQCGCLWIL